MNKQKRDLQEATHRLRNEYCRNEVERSTAPSISIKDCDLGSYDQYCREVYFELTKEGRAIVQNLKTKLSLSQDRLERLERKYLDDKIDEESYRRLKEGLTDEV